MQLPIPTPMASDAGGPAFGPALTSTTAPGKNFNNRSELQQHYKSDWHRYNLKRREAGLPMLNETDFTLRLEAAVALRKEREGREERSGVDHRKDKSKSNKKDKKKNKQQQQVKKDHKRKPAFAKDREEERLTTVSVVEKEEEENDDDAVMEPENENNDETSEAMDEEPPEINPSQCLFDNKVSSSPKANLEYMRSKYSFYLPDPEYCVDLEGLLGYCNEKVRLGNLCLYCQQGFTSTEGVLNHMRDKEHCKIQYERGVDQEEFDVFYDFSSRNRELFGENAANKKDNAMEVVDEQWEDVEEDGDGEWEDASMGEDDDDLYDGYQEEIATHGFDITPLGELIFPDGRIIGHRGLARYYKQRFAPDRTERAAVRAATEAGGDRLYNGRVVNLYQLREGELNNAEGETSTALTAMGRIAGNIPTGRNGRGILISGGGSAGFSSLSLYRYRAVVKKARRDDAKGQRLQYRQSMNMNKMGKKHNNLHSGVVMTHQPR